MMKQVQGDFLDQLEDQMEEHGSTSAMMDLDDVESLDRFGDGGGLSHSSDNNNNNHSHKLVDSDFFNSFEDDFDDSDIN